MLSKSMSERSAPQFGIGRRTKCSYAFTRNLVIHAGSPFECEISSTMSRVRPRWGTLMLVDSSCHPYRYPLPRFRSAGLVTISEKAPLPWSLRIPSLAGGITLNTASDLHIHNPTPGLKIPTKRPGEKEAGPGCAPDPAE